MSEKCRTRIRSNSRKKDFTKANGTKRRKKRRSPLEREFKWTSVLHAVIKLIKILYSMYAEKSRKLRVKARVGDLLSLLFYRQRGSHTCHTRRKSAKQEKQNNIHSITAFVLT